MTIQDEFSRKHGTDPLEAAIRTERAANPAPRLSEGAVERIVAMTPRPAAARAGIADHVSRIAGLFRPPVWGALAASCVAGIAAGAFVPAVTVASADLTPEEEFVAYLDAGDGLSALLEEDI